jgi:transposase
VPVLATEKKLLVLAALLEGNSIRAIERMTGVHRDTIMRLGLAWGEGAQRLHNRLARGLSCPLVQMDEMWSFVQKKQARVKPMDSAEVGEAYVFTALDSTSRFVISFHVGKRDQTHADLFMADIAIATAKTTATTTTTTITTTITTTTAIRTTTRPRTLYWVAVGRT